MTQKRIALVAHDTKKQDMCEWVEYNKGTLKDHIIYSTKTTGTKIEEATGMEVKKLKSGPKGGDQQVGSLITTRELDYLFFFWDPLNPHPHDVDVKALLRVAVLYDIPVACNRETADHIISSQIFREDIKKKIIPGIDDDEAEVNVVEQISVL